MSREELEKLVITLEEEMFQAAEELRFEYAAKLRDELKELRRDLLALADVEVRTTRRLDGGVRDSRRLDGGDEGAQVPALPAPERG